MYTLLKQLNLFSLGFGLCWLVPAGLPEPHGSVRGGWVQRYFAASIPQNQQKLQHHTPVLLKPFLALGWVLQWHLQLVLRRQRSICYYMSGNKVRAVSALDASWRHVCSFSNSRFVSSPFYPVLLSNTLEELIFFFLNLLALASLAQPDTNNPGKVVLFNPPAQPSLGEALTQAVVAGWPSTLGMVLAQHVHPPGLSCSVLPCLLSPHRRLC